MKRNMLIGGLAFVAIAASATFGISKYRDKETACPTPLMHLPKANVDVCVEPSFSWVYLKFDRPTVPDAFGTAVSQVPGVDVATSRSDDKYKKFRIVYFMSRTSEGEFISSLSSAIDDPKLYKSN